MMKVVIGAALAAAILAFAAPAMAETSGVARAKTETRKSDATDFGARRVHRRYAYRAYYQPYYPTYYARPVYYRPYPYWVPVPFFLGVGYGW